jgi:hypothetical protein
MGQQFSIKVGDCKTDHKAIDVGRYRRTETLFFYRPNEEELQHSFQDITVQ